jgi:NAD(P)-dependent dehydrogenase (short-subunit alcohol dehydrogenase family)
MELQDRVIVVTGGAGGIGAAMGNRFAEEGARAIVLVDIEAERAEETAAAIGPVARAIACDVSDFTEVAAMVANVEDREGPIDLFCSNAGIGWGIGIGDEDIAWQANWDTNLMSHVYAARALLPGWLERGEGYLLVTASAAGLLTTLGDAAYAASKHAAVGIAEWLSITYGDRGVMVSCLCPQGVRTEMVFGEGTDSHLAARQVKALRIAEPEEVADAVVKAISEERFLVLPHPEVARYYQSKAADHDRWLAAMRAFQHHLQEEEQ